MTNSEVRKLFSSIGFERMTHDQDCFRHKIFSVWFSSSNHIFCCLREPVKNNPLEPNHYLSFEEFLVTLDEDQLKKVLFNIDLKKRWHCRI